MEPMETQEVVPVKTKKNTKGWGIIRILILTAVMYGLMVAFAILGLLFADQFSLFDDDIAMDVFGNIGLGFGALIAVMELRKVTGERVRDSIKIKDFSILLVIMLTLAGWSLGEVCDHFMAVILSGFMSIEPDESSLSGVTGVISAVICAPIFEELIFRHSFIGLLKKNSGKVFTIVFTSLVFSLAHAYNIQNSADVFVGTLLAAYVFYKTGNLLYTICEHALHNALCFLPFGSFQILGKDLYYEKNGFVLAEWPWLIINMAVLIFSMTWLILYFKNRANRLQ